eukprot:TRINITY_DN5895_c0_g1_i1.p1 TRINITY_DN5895_c0_g1~~TRINITY_DN5895_c0_g1_i1.p1  ORF type:complete len:183 (-),score=19.41 TRINITY_DN5895_c0_g1_i1:401-949(-)
MWMLRPTRVWRRAAPTQGGISSSMIEAVPLRCIEALERRRDATMHAAMHDHTVKMLDTLEASTVESASTDAPGDEDACEDELSSASEDSSHDDATSSFAATKGFWEDLGSGSDPDEQDYLRSLCGVCSMSATTENYQVKHTSVADDMRTPLPQHTSAASTIAAPSSQQGVPCVRSGGRPAPW